MKISLITKTNTWHDEQLSIQAKKVGIELERLDLKSGFNEIDFDTLGDVILWRSSFLDTKSERASFLSVAEKKGKRIVNSGLIKFPFVTYKFFQQKYAEGSIRGFETIPTFRFKNKADLKKSIKNGTLTFPFIKKPNLGARGEGVSLIENVGAVDGLSADDLVGSIFQNFIENDGDFRVLVLGGRPLGVMKRVAKEGTFLNNISKGGNAERVEDKDLKERLFKMAAQIAFLFELGFCGVDIICNKENGGYYFLELNTVPQWQGFQGAIGINVANEIISYCLSFGKNISAERLVSSCYDDGHFLEDRGKQFHFLSRMYLWTGKGAYLERLKVLEDFFVGKDDNGWALKIEKLLREEELYTRKVCNKKKFRENIVKEYKMLGAYHEILFRNLIGETIFNRNLKKTISDIVGDEELIKIRKRLYDNEEHILKLSTFAVNYLYFLRDYFGEQNSELEDKVLDILEHFSPREEANPELIKNNIYFLTHCIIGESRFYQRNITENKKATYSKLIEALEAIISKNYFEITLDNKLEFIVCCNLLDYHSALRDLIINEAQNSFSEIGNFIVDKFKKRGVQDYFNSEHRNVLYLMAKTDFKTKT